MEYMILFFVSVHILELLGILYLFGWLYRNSKASMDLCDLCCEEFKKINQRVDDLE